MHTAIDDSDCDDISTDDEANRFLSAYDDVFTDNREREYHGFRTAIDDDDDADGDADIPVFDNADALARQEMKEQSLRVELIASSSNEVEKEYDADADETQLRTNSKPMPNNKSRRERNLVNSVREGLQVQFDLNHLETPVLEGSHSMANKNNNEDGGKKRSGSPKGGKKTQLQKELERAKKKVDNLDK